MIKTIREFLASCALDRPGASADAAASPSMRRVHGLLSGPAPLQRPAPELRGRIMDGLRDGPAPRASMLLARHGWALAAAVCIVAGWGAVFWFRPQPPARTMTGVPIPTVPAPVLQSVARIVGRDQANKMVDDTRRATRAVVNCVPFFRGG